jgi:hypothetical protein
MSPKEMMAQLYPQVLCSPFVAFYDLQGYGGGIPAFLNTGKTKFLLRKIPAIFDMQEVYNNNYYDPQIC